MLGKNKRGQSSGSARVCRRGHGGDGDVSRNSRLLTKSRLLEASRLDSSVEVLLGVTETSDLQSAGVLVLELGFLKPSQRLEK